MSYTGNGSINLWLRIILVVPHEITASDPIPRMIFLFSHLISSDGNLFHQSSLLFLSPAFRLPCLDPFHCLWISWLFTTNIPTSSNFFIGNAFVPYWNLLFLWLTPSRSSLNKEEPLFPKATLRTVLPSSFNICIFLEVCVLHLKSLSLPSCHQQPWLFPHFSQWLQYLVFSFLTSTLAIIHVTVLTPWLHGSLITSSTPVILTSKQLALKFLYHLEGVLSLALELPESSLWSQLLYPFHILLSHTPFESFTLLV